MRTVRVSVRERGSEWSEGSPSLLIRTLPTSTEGPALIMLTLHTPLPPSTAASILLMLTLPSKAAPILLMLTLTLPFPTFTAVPILLMITSVFLPVVFFMELQPCFQCKDLHAAFVHQIGHLLSLDHPDGQGGDLAPTLAPEVLAAIARGNATDGGASPICYADVTRKLRATEHQCCPPLFPSLGSLLPRGSPPRVDHLPSRSAHSTRPTPPTHQVEW